jgi:hypothetical protein
MILAFLNHIDSEGSSRFSPSRWNEDKTNPSGKGEDESFKHILVSDCPPAGLYAGPTDHVVWSCPANRDRLLDTSRPKITLSALQLVALGCTFLRLGSPLLNSMF